MTFVYSKGEQWKSSWIFFLMGFVGSFIALIFFRFIYMKVNENIQAIEEEEEEDRNREDALLEN